MNELLFKGKPHYSNIWVEGYGVVLTDDLGFIITSLAGDLTYKIPVDQKSISRYVGLDKKSIGGKLYEGDLVIVKGMKNTGLYLTRVIHLKYGFTLAENKTYLNDDSCLLAVRKIVGHSYDTDPDTISEISKFIKNRSLTDFDDQWDEFYKSKLL